MATQATVELRFSSLPAHVRTARLVTAAVARQAGVDEAVLDEVRLAVGEACSRVVGLHQRKGLTDPVRVRLVEQEKRFLVEVGDSVGPEPENADLADGPGGEVAAAEDASADDTMGLALISGLVDDVSLGHDDSGGVIRMSWPLVEHAVLPQPQLERPHAPH